MRILSVTPIGVGEQERRRRQARYDLLAPAGVEVVLHDVGDDAPRALETDADVVASDRAVLRALERLDRRGYDAVMPDCVLDPVVGAENDLGVPVLGIGRLAATFLHARGARIQPVARNRAIADELDRRLSVYAVDAAPTAVLELSVEDIADDRVWARAVDGAVAGTDGDHVLNACSAVDVEQRAGGPVVVDPTALALRLLALPADPGTSR